MSYCLILLAELLDFRDGSGILLHHGIQLAIASSCANSVFMHVIYIAGDNKTTARSYAFISANY